MDHVLAQAVQHTTPIAEDLSALVPLKIGTGRPVFIAHGLGGSPLEFTALARHIRSSHSIYGMRALGLDGNEMAFERIEDMARCYLSAIRNLQPRGPYLLVGHSLGGLVAWEMAQRLWRLQEKISLLVLIDSYPHSRFLSATQQLKLIAQLAIRHGSVLRRLPLPNALRYFFDAAERRRYAAPVEGRDPGSTYPVPNRITKNAYLALTRYRPAPYRGTVHFVKPAIKTTFPDDPATIWSALADKIELEEVPGTHHTMLTTHVDALAAALSRHLEAADHA